MLSISLHAAALLLRFQTASAPSVPQKMLEVALVNTETKLAPLEPKVLAQADLLGGGEHAKGISTSPLPRTVTEAADEVVLAALKDRQKFLEQEQQRLLNKIQSDLAVSDAQPRPDPIPESEHPGQDTYDQESLILSAQIAALKERIERYNAMPRQHYTGPSASADKYAQYLEAWRTQIELIGTENYPEEAKGRIYGSLQLTAYINRDGSLARIVIDRPSEHAILNLAAQRILQLAAPFAPLPPDIAQETDVLAITRTWHFQNQQLETHIP